MPQTDPQLRTVRALRYVTPLREGGSLPALVEADDDGLYVVKLRGAGQGLKALVAEIVAGEAARAAGLRVPELVLAELDPAIGHAEPDPEIQDLLAASAGVNAGMDFLPGSLPYAAAAPRGVDPELAADVVWLDALTTNVDRTPRNPNLLVWHGNLWLIDHGAALFRHHDPAAWPGDAAHRPFPQIRDHVLLPLAGSILDAHERLAPRLDEATLAGIAAAVPGEWLGEDPEGARRAYAEHLRERLASGAFASEAEEARAA